MKTRIALLFALTAWGDSQIVSADDPAVPLRTRIISVSLFKNGLGFVTREADLPKGDTRTLIEDLPAAVHGTFWAFSPDNRATVKELLAFEREDTQPVPAISVAEILEANVGKTVEVRVGETIRGTILAVPPHRTSDPATAPAAQRWSARSNYRPPTETASLLLLKTTNGVVALNKNAVQQVAVDGDVRTTVDRQTRTVGLQLRAVNPRGKGTVRIQYLAKGITWAPSCAIDITDPKQARLMAKATILNEIEDLDGLPVHLITGYPNLQFADVTDPLAMRGDLAAFLNNLVNPPQPGRSHGRAVVMQQAVMSNVAIGMEEMFPVFPAAAHEGQAREELFFYEQRDVTLHQGERGCYPLYTLEVPYEHIYQWKIGDTLKQQEPTDKPEEVWHSVRLANTGSVPWTTAPATITQAGEILGQDVIHYASPGSKTTVRVTQALDIRAEQAEYEVDRQRNAANFYGRAYDLVEVQGRLTASNYKAKDVLLTITKNLSGEVINSGPEAKVEVSARGLKKVNPNCLLSWELPVKAGDKIEIEYRYKLYVRD